MIFWMLMFWWFYIGMKSLNENKYDYYKDGDYPDF